MYIYLYLYLYLFTSDRESAQSVVPSLAEDVPRRTGGPRASDF